MSPSIARVGGGGGGGGAACIFVFMLADVVGIGICIVSCLHSVF